MQDKALNFLRCPVTRTPLKLEIIKKSTKLLNNISVDVISEGILYGADEWFYPVINGIPRLIVEAFLDYEAFFEINMSGYHEKRQKLLDNQREFISKIIRKNKKTKESFSREWKVFDYKKDRTWGMDGEDLVNRFCVETDETLTELKTKFVLDAGCGNAKLNMLLADKEVENVAMDFSNSIENAYKINASPKVHFVQGDVQFPPFAFNVFDVVHCSGVLIATNNTELSFSCLESTVKLYGKYSVWLYHPRKNLIHNLFNFLREGTSKMPLTLQNIFYNTTLLPISYVVKRMKGNKQNLSEMKIDILDWFSPEFRWEHSHTEAAAWFSKRNYQNIKVTTIDMFGFDIVGEKKC